MKRFTLLISSLFLFISLISAQVNLQNGLVAYYPLDSIAADLSTYGIQGNIYGAIPDTGKNNIPNTAFNFNGNTQYIECGTEQRGITDKVSVSAWIKKSDFNNSPEHIVTKYIGSNGTIQQGFHLMISNDGWPLIAGRLGEGGSSGYYYIIAEEHYILDGVWHHLLGTIDENTWDFYVDGVHEGTFISNSPNPSLVCPEVLTIGYFHEYATSYFNGLIDEVRLYNRVLNSDEIALLSDISFIDSSYMSISDIDNKLRVRLFPNPVNESVNIDFMKTISSVSIEFISYTGQVLLKNTVNNVRTYDFDISNFPNGMYLIRMQIDSDYFLTKKLIKN